MLAKVLTSPLINPSKSSIDAGRGSAWGLGVKIPLSVAVVLVAPEAGGKPLVADEGSMVLCAISSSREVAASSLRKLASESVPMMRDLVGAMAYRCGVEENSLNIPLDQGGEVMHVV